MRYPYLRLPIDADRGFPQAFRMALGTATYVVSCYVNVTDETLLTAAEALALPRPGAYLVVDIARETTADDRSIFRRKVVPGLEYEAEELALVFTDIAVHPANLNAAGPHGSRITAGVALRWAS
jgi:hypothetical protein